MKPRVISSAVVKVGPGTDGFSDHEDFLLPGDWLFVCAIRLENTCCYVRTVILPFVPCLHDLERSFHQFPKQWQFRAAGTLTL